MCAMSDDKHLTYRAVTGLQTTLPSLYAVKKERLALKAICSIKKNDNILIKRGVSTSWKQKSEQILSALAFKLGYFSDGNLEVIDGKTWSKIPFILKPAADGTNVCKTVKLLNHTFTVINDEEHCKAACGNYSIGLYSIKTENYIQTRACLEQQLKEMESTKSIELKGINFRIKFTNGGDMKFLLNLYGINASNSKYPCLWCKTESSLFHNFRAEHLKRNLDEAKELYKRNKFGYQNIPITTIPFDCCIIDTLHMLLRITDQLFELLLSKIELLDNSTKDDGTFVGKPHLKAFYDNLEGILKISNPFLTIDGKIKMRSLNGLDRLKIIESLNLIELFPDMPKVELHHQLWRDFFNIYTSLKNTNGYAKEDMAEIVKNSTLSWGNLYKSLAREKHVTPYIHAFVDHLHEMIAAHGDVCLWTMQGLEKLNDILTKEYFTSTNKHADFLEQLIHRRHRMEIMLLFSSDPKELFDLIHNHPEESWETF
jgi:hypothetical protein